MGENTLTLANQSPSCIRDALSRDIRPGGKESAVAQKVLTNSIEGTILLTKRGDEVLEEEVCSGGERYGVGDGGLQTIGLGLDGIEGLEDGGGGR